MWDEKKEQQTVFDDVAHFACSSESHSTQLFPQEDAKKFIRKVLTYIRKIQKGGVVIDVGCGTGTLFYDINCWSEQSAYYFVGIDISFESVKLAKQKNKYSDFVVCDIEALPFKDETCEMIVLRNVIHHLSNLECINDLVGLLGRGGFMLIDDKISGNPLQELLTSAFPLIPHKFKMILRDCDNHIDAFGNLPPIRRYNPKTYLNFLKRYPNLSIVETDYHGFFTLIDVLLYSPYFLSKLDKIKLPLNKLNSFKYSRLFRFSAVSMTIILESLRDSR